MNISTKSVLDTYSSLIENLKSSKKVYYTRFGDGEIYNIMGKANREHDFSPQLAIELSESFNIKHPQYLKAVSINYPREKMMSVGVFAPFSSNNELLEFLISKNYVTDNEVFENPIMIHYLAAFKPKLIYNLFEEHIRLARKLFVGSTPQNIAERLYGKIDYYINIPPQQAYDSIDKWWPKILACVDDVSMVIPSAGAATNVVSKRLWMLDKNIHLLDIGSLVDAVEGINTRTWIRLVGHKTQKILAKQDREKSIKKKLVFLLKDVKYFFRRLIK